MARARMLLRRREGGAGGAAKWAGVCAFPALRSPRVLTVLKRETVA
jgi:hypothetical protein